MSRENQKIWYLFDGTYVCGPMTKDEVRRLLADAPTLPWLIWDGSNSPWLSARAVSSKWASETKFDAWYFSVGSLQNGPVTLSEISKKIQSREVPLNSRFWKDGLKNWVGLTEVPQLVDAAGLLRRKVFRAPFVGEAEVVFGVDGGSDPRPMALTSTLSEGGVGLKNLVALNKGSKIYLKITSDLLDESFEAQAEVLFQKNHDSGLKFKNISEKTRSLITDYIKKYQESA